MYKIVLLFLLLISFIFIISLCEKIYEPMEISFNEASYNEILTNTFSTINNSLTTICGDLVTIGNI